MEYSNPEIPEGINTSKSHPLREFAWLTASVLVIALVFIAVLSLLVDRLAVHIPFSVEQQFASKFEQSDPANAALKDYLQDLADRIARVQGLPADMPIAVHYVDEDTVNAFATLGGHVVLFRGLLEKIPNENALALLLAHEIAHIQGRDPIRGLGRGVVLGLALSVISESIGNAVLDNFLSETGYFTVLKFSRDQERAADEAARATVTELYGSLRGADELFRILLDKKGPAGGPAFEFMSTHPLTEGRLQQMQSHQDVLTGDTPDTAPLPGEFSSWIGHGKAAVAAE